MTDFLIEQTVQRSQANEQLAFIEEHFQNPFIGFEALPLEEKWAIVAILGQHSSDEAYRTAKAMDKLTIELLYRQHYQNWTWLKKLLGS